jgi:hypothetical protein
VAIVVAYHGALTAGFVLDDYHLILEHRELGVGLIPRLFWRAYESGNGAFYRPLSTASFAIDRSLFGLWAPAYHAHNLVWHAAASLALLWLLGKIVSPRAAFAAALVFALHPVHTEAVTGVFGRSELMAATFVIVGVGLWLDGRRTLAALAYLAALASKESGVTLPLVALLVERATRPELRWRVTLERMWPLAAAFVVYAALRAHALAGTGETLPPPAEYFADLSWGRATLTALDVLGRDLRLLVWPHPLCADYSYPALPVGSLAGAARTMAILVAAVVVARRSRIVALALGWFAITILPVSNLVVHIGVLLAERLLYLPSVSVCLVAGAALAALTERARPALAATAATALALTLATLTMARNVDWQTPLALWRDTVAKQPRSALAHGNLGLSCVVVGDRECARRELEAAVALEPQRGDFRQALEQLSSR